MLYSVSLLICWDEAGRKGGGRGEGGDAVGWREGVCGSLSGCQSIVLGREETGPLRLLWPCDRTDEPDRGDENMIARIASLLYR